MLEFKIIYTHFYINFGYKWENLFLYIQLELKRRIYECIKTVDGKRKTNRRLPNISFPKGYCTLNLSKGWLCLIVRGRFFFLFLFDIYKLLETYKSMNKMMVEIATWPNNRNCSMSSVNYKWVILISIICFTTQNNSVQKKLFQ